MPKVSFLFLFKNMIKYEKYVVRVFGENKIVKLIFIFI